MSTPTKNEPVEVLSRQWPKGQRGRSARLEKSTCKVKCADGTTRELPEDAIPEYQLRRFEDSLLRRKGKPSSKKGDDVPTVPRRLDFSEVDSSSPEVTSNGAKLPPKKPPRKLQQTASNVATEKQAIDVRAWIVITLTALTVMLFWRYGFVKELQRWYEEHM